MEQHSTSLVVPFAPANDRIYGDWVEETVLTPDGLKPLRLYHNHTVIAVFASVGELDNRVVRGLVDNVGEVLNFNSSGSENLKYNPANTSDMNLTVIGGVFDEGGNPVHGAIIPRMDFEGSRVFFPIKVFTAVNVTYNTAYDRYYYDPLQIPTDGVSITAIIRNLTTNEVTSASITLQPSDNIRTPFNGLDEPSPMELHNRVLRAPYLRTRISGDTAYHQAYAKHRFYTGGSGIFDLSTVNGTWLHTLSGEENVKDILVFNNSAIMKLSALPSMGVSRTDCNIHGRVVDPYGNDHSISLAMPGSQHFSAKWTRENTFQVDYSNFITLAADEIGIKYGGFLMPMSAVVSALYDARYDDYYLKFGLSGNRFIESYITASQSSYTGLSRMSTFTINPPRV